jgi:hypothetical protein
MSRRHPDRHGSVGRRLLLVCGVAGAVALVACGGGREGTVVAKAHQATSERSCQASAIVTAPVSVPMSQVCSVPECWRLTIGDGDGDTFDACVSNEEYDRTYVGEFWHQRTD